MLKKIGYIVASLIFLCLIYFSGYQRGVLYQSKIPVSVPTLIPQEFDKEFDTDKIFNLVNEWRISQNLQPFRKLDGLCDAGKVRVYEIKRDWSHGGFEYSRIQRFSGYTSTEFGENLADFVTGTEEDILSGWLKSPLHLKNIKDNFVYTCVISEGTHVVQLFAR